jgi:integrase
MMLTDTAIRQTKPGEKPVKLADGGGLYLLVNPTGGKLWRWKYRFGGKEKLLALGSYPDVTLAKARERHQEARKLLAERVDPGAARKAAKTAARIAAENSFEAVARQWWAHWSKDRSAIHAVQTLRRLEADVFPELGALPVSTITVAALRGMAKRIERRGALDISKRALQTCGQVMRYAVANEMAERNPVADMKPGDFLQGRKQTNYARVDAKEFPVLLKTIDGYTGRLRTRLALQLMALTFVRTSELIEARWDEFDMDAARWNIPAERMKMRTPHIVPLSRQALAVLARLREISGENPLVFRGDHDHEKPMSNNALLSALKRMGYQGRMTGHGFRGVASTILHEQGWPHEHIELQLAHAKRDEVSAAYNHALYLPQRAKMMQAWADYLDELKARGKIIPMTRTA